MLAWWRCTIPTPMTTWPPWLFSTQSTSTTLECIVFFSQRVVTVAHLTVAILAQVRAVSVTSSHMRSWCVRFSLDFDLSFLFTFYLTQLLSHSFHFLHLKFADNLRIPPKESMDSFDETYSHTSYEPNAYDFKETSVESYTELLTSPPFLSDRVFPKDAEYDDAALEGMLREAQRVQSYHSQREDLSVGLSSSSVSERTERPVEDRAGRSVGPCRMHRSGLCSTNKESKFLPSARQKSTDTNFKPLTTEEVYENCVKLLNPNKKNFTALELKNFNDEINSFFMDSYCRKIWNYVKLIRKVSVKWKNLRSFRVQPSTLLRDEDWSRKRTLSWNFLARYSNCKMKLIVWMIQRSFRMLNQYAVDIPTLPVDQYHSHLIQFLVECSAVL